MHAQNARRDRRACSDGLCVPPEPFEQRCMEALPNLLWERDRLRIAEDLYGLAGRIDNKATIPAAREMLLEVGLDAGVEAFFQITRQFKNDFLAIHCAHPVENIYSVSGGASTVPATGAILPPLRRFPELLPSHPWRFARRHAK